MEKVPANELRDRLAYYVKRVRKGESFEVVDEHGDTIAELVPVNDAKERELES